MTTVSEAGEHALLARLKARVGPAPPWVRLGIGDDAAVFEPERNRLAVATTDSLVEDVHFRLAWSQARQVGRKALAVNLSDLAAMGASPRACLLSLALPASLSLDDFDGLCDGFLDLAASARVSLIGGNLTRSPGPLVIDVTAFGSVHARRLLTRSGGRPGDELYVSGTIGGAAAGLAVLQASGSPDDWGPSESACVARYRVPEARLRLGLLVARNRAASACMDLSDGLADAARQMAEASGTGVTIDEAALPVDPSAAAVAAATGSALEAWTMSGGEDYELLFAVPERRRKAFLFAARQAGETPVTAVGRLTKAPGVWLARGDSRIPCPPGFRHFA